MAWAQNTIRLGAAARIFPNCNVQVVEYGGVVVGYSATVSGETLEHTGLTDLCIQIVQKLETQNKED